MTTLPDKTDFRLVRFFTTTSVIAFIIVACLLGYVFRSISIDAMVRNFESQHTNLARVIANEMGYHKMELFFDLSRSGQQSDQKSSSANIASMNKEMLSMLSGTSIFKIKLYDLKGITVFSTEKKQIGEDKSKNAGVISSLQGRATSKLTHKDSFSAFEGEIQNRDLVESYVPLHDPVTGRVIGAFEIYGDATTSLARTVKKEQYITGAVIGLLSLLYLALFIIVKRAQNLISRQNVERQRDREALKVSEERWKFALEGAGEGVWDRNLRTGEVVFSKRYKEIYGFAEDELVGQHEQWYARIHPDDIQQVTADRDAYFASQNSSYTNERRMLCKDGSWKWILSRGMVVSRDAQGEPLRMIGTHSDITERKHAEEENLSLLKQLHQAQRLESLGVLAGGIAHDFNNILVVITNYASMAQLKPEKAAEFMPKIIEASDRAAALSRQMLAYAGKTHFIESRIDMTALVDEMIQMMKPSLPKNVTIKSSLAENLPNITGDNSQIRQIVMSMIINASEAIGDVPGDIRVALEEITIEIDAGEKDHLGKAIAHRHYLRLEVADSGCGMDAETKRRIFEPFYTTKFFGRGLGMSAVLGAITSHRGALQLNSEPGEGSTFKIYFPCE